MNVIFKGTPAGDPGRRLMVDFHVRSGLPAWINVATPELINHEFLFDVTVALLGNRGVLEETRQEITELTTGVPSSYHHVKKDPDTAEQVKDASAGSKAT